MTAPTISTSGGSRTRGCMTAIILAAVFLLLTGVAALFAGGDDDDAAQAPVESLPFGAVPPEAVPGVPVVPGASVVPGGGATLFPGRPGALPTDQEHQLGEAADIGGMQATPNGTASAGSVVIGVTLTGGTTPRPYSTTHWKLQLPDGRMLDVSPKPVASPLRSGQIPAGGTVSGQLTFDTGTTPGPYYLLWTPDPAVATRGVWQVPIG